MAQIRFKITISCKRLLRNKPLKKKSLPRNFTHRDRLVHCLAWRTGSWVLDDTTMTTLGRALVVNLALLACGDGYGRAVELRVGRQALERTLQQQLFASPQGRYYLRGNAQSACSVYDDDPHLAFEANRIVVKLKTHARLGKAVGGACLGIALSPAAEVSFTPEGEGEIIGFRDARVERVSDREELNFILNPFLRHQVPSSMKVNAADLLRKALADSTATSGYKVALDRLKIHSVHPGRFWAGTGPHSGPEPGQCR